MKTLKQDIKRIPYLDLREYQIDLIVKVCIENRREWLQQFDGIEDPDGNLFISKNQLLEELE